MNPTVRHAMRAVLLVSVITGCGAPSPSAVAPASPPSPSPSIPVAPTPVASGAATVLPPLVDVTSFRGGADRAAIEPGPGPVERPVLAWELPLDRPSVAFPILVGGLMIVGLDDGRIIAIDAHTGNETWSQSAPGPLADSSFSAAGGTIIVPYEGGIEARSAADGTSVWTHRIAHLQQRPSIVDGIVYIGSVDGVVVGLDLTDGSERWRWAGPRNTPVRVDLVAGGIAYVSTFDGRLIAVRLSDGVTTGTHTTRAVVVGAPNLADGRLYTANRQDGGDPLGEMVVLDPVTLEAAARFTPPSGLQAINGPVRDGIVYVNTTHDGVLALRDAGDAFTKVWEQPDAPTSYWPPVLVEDLLYVPGADGTVTAIRTADGGVAWTTDTTGGEVAGPILSGGMLLFIRDTLDGRSVVSAFVEAELKALLDAPVTVKPTASPEPVTVGSLAVDHAFDWTGGHVLDMDYGPDGLLYVLDVSPAVRVIDPSTGTELDSWGSHGAGNGEFDLKTLDGNPGIGAIAVSKDGRVHVADGANHRVQIFAADGTYQDQYGSSGVRLGQFSRPFRIDVSDDGSRLRDRP